MTKRLHSDFLFKLSKSNEFFVYGQNEDKINGPEISPIIFDSSITINDLIKEFDPDIIIPPEYAKLRQKKNKLHELSFKNTSVPVIIIEIDSYEIQDKNKYPEYGIDFIIERAPDIEHKIPSVWLPLSANEDDFFTDPDSDYISDRYNKLVFVGGGRYSRNKYYSTRQKAIRYLEAEDLMTYEGECGFYKYPNILKSYIGALSCSFPPLYHLAGKAIEIMASGTALLTTKIGPSKRLFGDKQCFFTYNENCEDIVSITKSMLENRDNTREVIHNALTIVNEKHLDKHRIIELQNILNAIVYGGEIPDLWGEK